MSIHLISNAIPVPDNNWERTAQKNIHPNYRIIQIEKIK